jgi:hypothetical protein
MLHREVTESEINAVVIEHERPTVCNFKGTQTVHPPEPRDSLVTTLKKSDVKICSNDTVKLTGECCGHPTNSRADFNHRLLLILRVAKTECLQKNRDLIISRRHEIGKGEMITRDVIEDPPSFSNDFISTGLTIRDAARNFPRNELRTLTH